MHWLAEQGLVQKRALLVIITLTLFLAILIIFYFSKKKGERIMKNTSKRECKIYTILNFISNLCGNIISSALLANALYDFNFVSGFYLITNINCNCKSNTNYHFEP